VEDDDNPVSVGRNSAIRSSNSIRYPFGLAVLSIRLLAHFHTMSASCEPLLEALKDCLMRSDCVLKKGKLPSECLRQHTDELPESCKSLRQAVFECKRGLVSPLGPRCICYGFIDGIECRWI
jgi:hypothetical protein